MNRSEVKRYGISWLHFPTADRKLIELVAASVSLLGLVGWVWMIPRLAPLPWALPGAAADLEPAGQGPR